MGYGALRMNSVDLFLLFLVAVGIGWLLVVRSGERRKVPGKPNWFPNQDDITDSQSERFIKGLLESAPGDEETMDFALRIGQSLREKGETHRAIQFHQALLARTDLPRSLLQEVELELALDYYRAGLNDSSENLLLNLVSAKVISPTSGADSHKALHVLVRLYEEEGEWQKILDLHHRLKITLDDRLRRSLSHAACELAVQAIDSRNYLNVRRLVHQALKIDASCARAQVVLGDLAFRHQESKEAIRCYLKALEIDPNCLVALLDRLIVAFRSSNDDQGLYLHLRKSAQTIDYVPALLAMAEVQVPHAGFESALDGYLERLSERPSHYGIVSFLGLLARNNRQLSESQLRSAYDILRKLDASESRFVCRQCGFEGRQFYWRCPS